MEKYDYFISPVYLEKCEKYLDLLKNVSSEYENYSEYGVYQSDNFAFDKRISGFANYVAQSAWDILNTQGYAMNRYETYINELWLQVYKKNNFMDQHVHSNNSQLSGFYFLDTPENCSRILIHDPRPGKNQINLPEKNREEVTYASEMINFIPYPGMLFLTNSWIQHSLSINMSDNYTKVIHFNITVRNFVPPPPPAEVI